MRRNDQAANGEAAEQSESVRNSQVSRRNDASITARANEIAKQSDEDAFASGQQVMTASEQERVDKSDKSASRALRKS